jgi:hypothetical protein
MTETRSNFPMDDSDPEFALHEKTLHSEMVFAIRRFFVCARRPIRDRHKAVFNALKPLVEESKYFCEIWEEDEDDDK